MVEDTGYGRPPVHSRFKKGQSGNPSGRPKAAPSFESDLLRELRKPHSFQEDGEVKTETKQSALLQSLFAAALSNDMRALNMLLTLMRHYDVDRDAPGSEEPGIEDLDAMQTYIDKQRKLESEMQHPTTSIESSSKD